MLKTKQKLLGVVAVLLLGTSLAGLNYFSTARPRVSQVQTQPLTNFIGPTTQSVSRTKTNPSSPLDTRQGCLWTYPGSNPWRGNTEQALVSLGLSDEEVQGILFQIREHHPADMVTIQNDSIRGYHYVFETNMAMAFGDRTVCYGTVPDFKIKDHSEKALIYHYNNVWIMIPEVCNNITRVYPLDRPAHTILGEIYRPDPLSVNLSPAEAEVKRLLIYPILDRKTEFIVGHKIDASQLNSVPEPSTYLLVLPLLLFIYLRTRNVPKT